MKVFIIADIGMGKFLKSKNKSDFDILRARSESFWKDIFFNLIKLFLLKKLGNICGYYGWKKISVNNQASSGWIQSGEIR